MNLVESLKKILANNFVLYLKGQYFHWNVEGPDFAQLHSFFGDFYEEVYSSIDKFAEEIRALDAYAPGSLERFIELSDIKGDDNILSGMEMIKVLKNDNEIMLESLMNGFKYSESEKQLGLSNFIQDRIDQHKKHAWMFRSFLKPVRGLNGQV